MSIPKNWKDEPNVTTPVDAAGLIDLEERVYAAALAAAVAAAEDLVPVGAEQTTNKTQAVSGESETKYTSEKAVKLALATKSDIATREASGMGVVYHGSTAGTARPTGYKQITWIGTVEPTNATEHDIWYNPSA